MSGQHDWKWFGHAGHCIVADRCRWHLHTEVGDFRVSTIGDYHNREGDRETLGAADGSWFETMVFKLSDTTCECGCGAREPSSWGDIDGERYADRLSARDGHLRFCEKYAGGVSA